MVSAQQGWLRAAAGRILVLVAAGLLCGCATGQGGDGAGQDAAKAQIGFLSDYARLKPMEGQKSAKVWRDDSVRWSKFDKVLIERIKVFLKDEGARKGIDPTDLKDLMDYFYQALTKAVGQSATLVHQPGPGVLRVRIAIVDLMPTSAAASVAGTCIPYAFAAELASGPVDGRPAGSTPYLGQTGIQAQFLDGATGQVVAEFADTEVGRKYVAELDKGVSNAATQWANGYFHSFTTWGYAKDAFDLWAKLLHERFDQLRGVKPNAKPDGQPAAKAQPKP